MSPGYMIPGNDAGKKSYANKKETQKFCDRQNELSYHREIEYQITEGTLEDEERDYRER